jgi:ANTAR domain
VAVQPAAGTRRTERPGFLLDLITGTETDLDSMQRLAEAGALALGGLGDVDCAAMLARAGSPPALAGSTAAALDWAGSEDRHGDGPLTHAMSAAELVKVDGGTSARWQAYQRRLETSGYGGALAVPLVLEDRSSCALLFLVRRNTGLTPELVAEAAWFAEVASQSLQLAIEVRSVRSAGDNLKTVLESRTSIDVACGVLMAQNSCSYTEAFSKLAGASRQRNLKVRSVAENVVKAMAGGTPAARFDPQASA